MNTCMEAQRIKIGFWSVRVRLDNDIQVPQNVRFLQVQQEFWTG